MSKSEAENCDFCQAQVYCSNIFVALKILEEEARYCDDQRIKQRLDKLLADLKKAEFNYPHSDKHCALASDIPEVKRIMVEAKQLLGELRQQVAITQNKFSHGTRG